MGGPFALMILTIYNRIQYMHFLQTTYRIILACTFLMLAASSCTDEAMNELEPMTPSEPVGSSAFITLNITAPVQTRANTPEGGENGDGSLPDETYEDKIENVVVFFYKTAKEENFDQAATNGATIQAVAHFEELTRNGDQSKFTTETKEVKLKDGTYRMLVVANLPTSAALPQAEASLSELGQYVYHSLPWTCNNSSYSRFIMSSQKEKTITLEAKTTSEDRPLDISGIELQRLAARIDFMPTQNNQYTTTDGNFDITVKGIKIINRMVSGSFLLKHTATDIANGSYTTLGEETENAKKATNYVVDPWSSGKTLQHYKDGENAGGYKYLYEDRIEDGCNWTEDDNIKETNAYYRLGYVLENTTDKDSQLCGYSTGVMIKAVGIPRKYINDEGKEKENNTVCDFCTYNNKVYKDRKALKAVTSIEEKDFEDKGVKEYKDGVMYYPYFIRHCYNGTTSNAIMEFAIVRNNVYQLQINSFSSPGNTEDVVDPETPSKETLVVIGTSIRPWKQLEDENIIM